MIARSNTHSRIEFNCSDMVRCALFVVAIVCVALASSDDQTENEKKLLQKCLQESRTNIADLNVFINGQPYPDGVKCLFKCLMQGHNTMTEDGTVDVEAVVNFAGEDKRTSSEKCKARATSTNLCEKAIQYETCFLAEEPEFFKATFKRLTR